MLEAKINALLAKELRSSRFLVLQNVRIHPCEMDIVVLDRYSLRLVNIEIKRFGWRALLAQAMRGALYCHYSIAALPYAMRDKVPADEFRRRGVGLAFFAAKRGRAVLGIVAEPALSTAINRSLKRQVYSQFASHYAEAIHA